MQSPPVVERDPVAAIRRIQESQQRFGRGLVAAAVASLLAAPLWAIGGAATKPASPLQAVVAMVCGVLVGLPMRWFGRAIQLRLALAAGALAMVTIALGDLLMRAAGMSVTLKVAPGLWRVWFEHWHYLAAAFGAVLVARREFNVELAGDRIKIAPPLPFEDANEVVFNEPANIRRGLLSVPGQLVLTRSELRYTERGTQVASPVIPLSDIVAAEQGWISSSFTLTLWNDQKVSFVVFDRDKWIVHVNARLGPP
jgi:hypothetical protein